MKNAEILQEMQAFLRDELSPEERALVSEKIKENPLYAFALEQLEEGIEAGLDPVKNINNYGPTFTGALLDKFDGAAVINAPEPWWRSMRLPLVAAVAALVVIGLSLLLPREKTNPQTLALEAILAHPYEESLTTLSQGQSETDSLKSLMLFHYGQHTPEAYQEALPLVEQLLEQDTLLGFRDQTELRLCATSMHLSMESTEAAFEQLIVLQQALNSPFEDEIRWMEALAYLQGDSVEAGQAALRELEKRGSKTYQSRATELLKELD